MQLCTKPNRINFLVCIKFISSSNQLYMPIKKILFYIIGTCSLLIPAFYNGYPLVYSDTGSYMFGGMDLVLPKDRPIMYGLFIHFFSLNFSLWMVICAQALIVFFVLWQVFKLAANSPVSKRFFILSMALLSWFTGLGWYTSQLMPDIFTIISQSLKNKQHIDC